MRIISRGNAWFRKGTRQHVQLHTSIASAFQCVMKTHARSLASLWHASPFFDSSLKPRSHGAAQTSSFVARVQSHVLRVLYRRLESGRRVLVRRRRPVARISDIGRCAARLVGDRVVQKFVGFVKGRLRRRHPVSTRCGVAAWQQRLSIFTDPAVGRHVFGVFEPRRRQAFPVSVHVKRVAVPPLTRSQGLVTRLRGLPGRPRMSGSCFL